MQKVEGSSPFSRLIRKPRSRRGFRRFAPRDKHQLRVRCGLGTREASGWVQAPDPGRRSTMAVSPDIAEILRRHRLRVTPQRRAILEAFRGTRDEHLSAEEVLSRASLTVPEISRGTVYASLAELTELGLLSSVGDVGPVRYETNTEPHDHFQCRLCMRMFDLVLSVGGLMPQPPEGYSVESLAVRAEGICAACHAYQRGLADGVRSIKEQPTLDAEMVGALSCVVVDSPVGRLAFAASGEGIVRVAFAEHADFDALTERAARPSLGASHSRLRLLGDAVEGYFAGSRAPLSEAIDWRLSDAAASETLRRVWDIPFGESASYQDVCAHINAYDCGMAMGNNPVPLLIPCHRVSCGSCRPDSYVGGPKRLHFLHDLEAHPG
jgi:Fe2+ or Zn2+ uptake regulation protein/O6-methylguanine-DNA--protein-cysteine methyltransferase